MLSWPKIIGLLGPKILEPNILTCSVPTCSKKLRYWRWWNPDLYFILPRWWLMMVDDGSWWLMMVDDGWLWTNVHPWRMHLQKEGLHKPIQRTCGDCCHQHRIGSFHSGLAGIHGVSLDKVDTQKTEVEIQWPKSVDGALQYSSFCLPESWVPIL